MHTSKEKLYTTQHAANVQDPSLLTYPYGQPHSYGNFILDRAHLVHSVKVGISIQDMFSTSGHLFSSRVQSNQFLQLHGASHLP